MIMNFRNGDGNLITEINVDYKTETVKIKNHTDDLLLRAFGINENPTFKDFEEFLEYRSIPQTRHRFKTEMRLRGIEDTSPLGIVRHYNGRMADDDCYIEFVED